MTTCEIDTNRLFLMMDTIRDVLISKGKDGLASNLVQQQTKLLARTITNFIPPIKEKGSKGSPRLNGEQAIEKDLCSLFSEAKVKTIDEVGSIHGIKNIDAWLTQKEGGKLHLQWDNLDPMAAHMPEEHNRYRGRYGTVKRMRSRKDVWKARVVIPQGSRKPYMKTVQSRVGRAKCSIARVVMKLGGSNSNIPKWIARHSESLGDKSIAEINLSNPAAPSITFGSRAPGITRFRSRVQAAVNFRVKVMGRLARLMAKDCRDWKQLRARSNALKRQMGEGAEVVE